MKLATLEIGNSIKPPLSFFLIRIWWKIYVLGEEMAWIKAEVKRGKTVLVYEAIFCPSSLILLSLPPAPVTVSSFRRDFNMVSPQSEREWKEHASRTLSIWQMWMVFYFSPVWRTLWMVFFVFFSFWRTLWVNSCLNRPGSRGLSLWLKETTHFPGLPRRLALEIASV